MKNNKSTRAKEFLENNSGFPTSNRTEEFDSLGNIVDGVLINLMAEIRRLEMRIVQLEKRVSPDSSDDNKEVKSVKKIGAIIVGSD